MIRYPEALPLARYFEMRGKNSHTLENMLEMYGLHLPDMGDKTLRRETD